jgi:hypothetical protein
MQHPTNIESLKKYLTVGGDVKIIYPDKSVSNPRKLLETKVHKVTKKSVIFIDKFSPSGIRWIDFKEDKDWIFMKTKAVMIKDKKPIVEIVYSRNLVLQNNNNIV